MWIRLMNGDKRFCGCNGQRQVICNETAAAGMSPDDLIAETVHLFGAFPEVADYYRRRFRHILVDEYQDTNPAQYALIRALAGDGGNQLMGLGFPDQTVIWDAAAAGETARALLDAQSPVLPLRTVDVANGFGSSLASEGPSDEVQKLNTDFTPVQALW